MLSVFTCHTVSLWAHCARVGAPLLSRVSPSVLSGALSASPQSDTCYHLGQTGRRQHLAHYYQQSYFQSSFNFFIHILVLSSFWGNDECRKFTESTWEERNCSLFFRIYEQNERVFNLFTTLSFSSWLPLSDVGQTPSTVYSPLFKLITRQQAALMCAEYFTL